LALTTGNPDLARERLVDAAKAFKAFEMWEELLDCLEDLAALSAQSGALERAIRLSAVATEARARLRLARSPRYERRWATQLDSLRNADDLGRFEAEWVVGAAWSVDDALSAFQTDLSRPTASSEIPAAAAVAAQS
jgi:hypothetical protein